MATTMLASILLSSELKSEADFSPLARSWVEYTLIFLGQAMLINRSRFSVDGQEELQTYDLGNIQMDPALAIIQAIHEFVDRLFADEICSGKHLTHDNVCEMIIEQMIARVEESKSEVTSK